MSDDRDPIIDACLEELLGAERPPDLKDQILEKWRSRSGVASGRNGAPVLLSPTEAVWGIPRIRTSSRRRRHRQRAPWGVLVVAAMVLGCGTLAWLVWGNHLGMNLANRPVTTPPRQPDRQMNTARHEPIAAPTVVGIERGHDSVLAETTPGGANSYANTENTEDDAAVDSGGIVAASDENLASVAGGIDPWSDAEIIRFINAQVRRSWDEADISPAAPASDSEWCRRTYLMLVGRLPQSGELRLYSVGRSRDKRENLVSSLCASDDFADHWATIWTTVLIGLRGGGQSELARREELADFLRTAVAEATPYDQLVYELLACTGSNTPGDEDFSGATNFLLALADDGWKLATARTSRVFLGSQLRCAECHDHPSSPWKQHQFWQLNAFFRQMEAIRDPGSQVVRLVDRDFVGEGDSPDEGEVYFNRPDGLLVAAYPVFLDGKELPRTGRLSEVNRRRKLAEMVSSSPDLSRAVVNRLWSHFLGFGLARPVDDMGSHNPPSHPELLAGLAGQLEAHHYDLRALMRWICLSEPFALSSAPSGGADDPANGSVALFSRYYERSTLMADNSLEPMRALASLRRGDLVAPNRPFLGQLAPRDARVRGADSGSPPQIVPASGGTADRGMLERIAASDMSLVDKIDHIFLAGVARRPTQAEVDLAQEVVKASGGNVAAALYDIWSALAATNEFVGQD
jgi:hypothetical protein